ncbi:MAG TPA: SDR family oxidoreductase [Afifellaceae bacterium]|nr:SDR family oxidoreductase [Afifellaceae bacterium]
MAEAAGERVAIVFGASRGLGKAIAAALLDEGFRVAGVCRTRPSAEALESELSGKGEIVGLAADVDSADAVSAAVAVARERFGRIDCSVVNAGVIEPIGHVGDCSPAEWAANIRTNLVGAFHCVHFSLAAMLAQGGGGTIVNISSGAAGDPLEGWSAYCAAKAGLAMLTRSVQLEYGERGIKAYGFRPGVTDTDMQGVIRASGMNPISRLKRSDLTRPALPAAGVAWLCRDQPPDLAGGEVSFGDPAFRRRAGLG